MGPPSILIGFTDGTKTEGCGIDPATASSVEAQQLSDTTISGGTSAAPSGTTTNGTIGIPYFPLTVQVSRTGTTYTCAWSYNNGASFVSSFVDSVPFLTATSVAVYAQTRTGSTPVAFTLVSYN